MAGIWKWGRGKVWEDKGRINGDWSTLEWWTHNATHQWCITELYSWNLYNFISRCHLNKFSVKNRITLSSSVEIPGTADLVNLLQAPPQPEEITSMHQMWKLKSERWQVCSGIGPEINNGAGIQAQSNSKVSSQHLCPHEGPWKGGPTHHLPTSVCAPEALPSSVWGWPGIWQAFVCDFRKGPLPLRPQCYLRKGGPVQALWQLPPYFWYLQGPAIQCLLTWRLTRQTGAHAGMQ